MAFKGLIFMALAEFMPRKIIRQTTKRDLTLLQQISDARGCSDLIRLKKAYGIGIKTFVSIEPWIPEITHPQSIIEKLKDSVDRFIIGSMQYYNVSRSFYAKHLSALIAWLKENKIDYYLKKELRFCLANYQAF